MSEYDAHSRANTQEYRENYDRIFGRDQKEHEYSPECALRGCEVCQAKFDDRNPHL